MRLWSQCRGLCKSFIHPSIHPSIRQPVHAVSMIVQRYARGIWGPVFLPPPPDPDEPKSNSKRSKATMSIMARRSGTNIFDGCNAAARRVGNYTGHDLKHIYVSCLVFCTTSLSPACKGIVRRSAASRKDDCWRTAHCTFGSASVEPFVRRA